MRVAFDEQIFAIQRHGGISRVFAELAHKFVANPDLGIQLQPVAAPLVNEYILRDPLTAQALAIRPSKHWGPSIARSLARRRHKGPVDIVHNTFYLPRALADYPEAKRVVTIHDMIPELLPHTRRRLDILTVKRRYVERADHIVCVSGSTKRDLVAIYGPIASPITVIHSGVGSEFQPGAPPIPKWPNHYILHVGHRGSYKGGRTLLHSFAKVARDYPDVILMYAGGGSLTRQEQSEISSLGLTDRVFQQQVSEALMPGAYANADLFVFPSEYEGFGLPALEAMASGTAMILCNSSSLPEVGGDAAQYFPPGDSTRLAELIGNALSDPKQSDELRVRGLNRVKNFTWQSTAEALANTYRLTVQGGSL